LKEIFARQQALIPPKDQDRLKDSSLLVAGVGGLGCVAAEILVRSGVGSLYLLDHKVVDAPDLNRQILYTRDDLGQPKVEAACKRLKAIRPEVEIFPLKRPLEAGFVLPPQIVGVIDALDNWSSRFLLDTLCQERGCFLVHAGLDGFFGQVTSIIPGKTPRLSEIFAGAKEEKTVPATAFICFFLGAIQALEAIKLILDWPDTLAGRLLIVDLSLYRWEILPLAKTP